MSAPAGELAFDRRRGITIRTISSLPGAGEGQSAVRAKLAGRRLCVFLDYDGTLTPIVPEWMGLVLYVYPART